MNDETCSVGPDLSSSNPMVAAALSAPLGESIGATFSDSRANSFTSLAELRPNFKPENTAIAFDLHDVLVRFKLKQALRHLSRMEGKKKVAKLLMKPRIAKKMFSNKVHVEQRLKDMIEEELDPTRKLIMQNELQTITYQIYNSHDFDPNTLALITELNDFGYRLFLLSNIGSECFAMFQAAIPEIFGKFTGFYTANAEDQYRKKPSPVVFNSFLKRFEHLAIENFIFVDDKQENVDGAKLAGLHGIVYEDAIQLRHELVGLRVLPKRPTFHIEGHSPLKSSSSNCSLLSLSASASTSSLASSGTSTASSTASSASTSGFNSPSISPSVSLSEFPPLPSID